MCRWRVLLTFSIYFERKFILHLLSLMAVTFLIVLPICSKWLKYSVYHPLWPRDKEHRKVEMQRENNIRLEMAESHLMNIRSKHIRYGDITGSLDVGISVITVSRNRHAFDSYEPKYLTQVVSYFDKMFRSVNSLRFSYQLFICVVDDDPSSYYEAQRLSAKFETFYRFPVRNSSEMINKPYRMMDERLEKEKQDYLFCGDEVLKRNASNIFLVEDDALPHGDLVGVLEYILQNYISSNFGANSNRDVAYFKLYHPDRLLGYISLEAERLPELLSISILLASALTFIYLRVRPNMTSFRALVWTGFLIYSSLLFIFMGRQTFLELRRISRSLYQVTPAPSCCTPAMLYTRRGFTKIAEHLKSVRCKSRFGKDTALDEYRRQSGLTARMVQPNLFSHIGMYSSLRDQVLDPFIV